MALNGFSGFGLGVFLVVGKSLLVCARASIDKSCSVSRRLPSIVPAAEKLEDPFGEAWNQVAAFGQLVQERAMARSPLSSYCACDRGAALASYYNE